MRLAIAGLHGPYHALVQIVDAQHGSPLTAWEAMGRPAFPTRHQVQVLREAAVLQDAATRDLASGDPATLSLTLQPHALALVRVVP